MIESIDLLLQLMHKDKHVADVTVMIHETMWSVKHVLITDEQDTVAFAKTPGQMWAWMNMRLMPHDARHYINLIKCLFQTYDMRLPSASLIISLINNGRVVYDDYWFNVPHNIDFMYNEKNITVKHVDWNQINDIISPDITIQNLLLADILLITGDNLSWKTHDPTFTTNGYKQKRWISQDNVLHLEKRLTISQLNDEIKCLDFFKSRGIHTPEHKHIHIDVNDKTLYFPETIHSGIDVIRKKRLNERGEEIFPLIWFVNEDNANSLELMINYMGNILGVNKEDSDNFINAITSHLTQNEYRKIASDNLGFIKKSDGSFKPAVWSNVIIK